ncbi:TPA: hypothetical protein QDC51_001429 [Burkholderia multivorans]|nr:hypothetical protein [Burkholderia multivorans]HDR9840789.1 hypothetical protein [Burkholderia multivorans]HDR9847311.1 hypothetical protein [Burkholderia multivorans]HDR9853724.1 hypothetical protein [Burkholderia multivorans]
MSKYEKLDAMIVEQIDDIPRSFTHLRCCHALMAECDRHAKEAGTKRSPYGVDDWRVLDRRLQALRKAGKIKATSKGWIRAGGES